MSQKVCNYPDCVDREPDGKCASWITAACPGPDECGNAPTPTEKPKRTWSWDKVKDTYAMDPPACPNLANCKGLCFECEYFDSSTGKTTYPDAQPVQPAADFDVWWQKHGQFCRAGGGDYEKTFAFRAWEAAIAQPSPKHRPLTDSDIEKLDFESCTSLNFADNQKKFARAVEAAIAQPVQTAPPESSLHSLARRCLWIAYCWNEHNFSGAYTYARQTAQELGINNFDEANEWLIAQPVQPAPCTPLTTEDYSAIRGRLCESHPGVWLHHYGPAVEAEVLKRLAPDYVVTS